MKYKTKIINDFVLLKKQAEKIQIKIDSLNGLAVGVRCRLCNTKL